MADTFIRDWDMNQLTRFVNQLITEHEVASNPNRIFDEVEITRRLRIKDEVSFQGSTLTSPGAAGAASALPATPELYVKVLDPYGIVRLIPLFQAP